MHHVSRFGFVSIKRLPLEKASNALYLFEWGKFGQFTPKQCVSHYSPIDLIQISRSDAFLSVIV